jgi:hypothetical protein
VRPLDPGEYWLAAGITGLPRQREWDAVATVEGPGDAGDEAQFVVLADGRLLLEEVPESFGAAPFAEALAGSIDPPYRAVARRLPELWAVGAASIEVVRLSPDPRGDELELTFDGEQASLLVDRMPASPGGAESLRSLAESRERGAYAAHAHRLTGDLWEIQVLPL